jgi:hypothetical protein
MRGLGVSVFRVRTLACSSLSRTQAIPGQDVPF